MCKIRPRIMNYTASGIPVDYQFNSEHLQVYRDITDRSWWVFPTEGGCIILKEDGTLTGIVEYDEAPFSD